MASGQMASGTPTMEIDCESGAALLLISGDGEITPFVCVREKKLVDNSKGTQLAIALAVIYSNPGNRENLLETIRNADLDVSSLLEPEH